jgi:uncharacterized RDD family membrane protein YckC
MTYALPDPDRHAEFYRNVAVKRGVAWVIDCFATTAITALIVPFTAFTALFFLPLLFLVVNFVYRAAFLANASATPGMWLTGIEFRRLDGGRLDTGTAIAHTMGTIVTWGFMLPQVASVLLMLLGPRGQGLSDLVLGTAAINRPARF